MTALSCLLRSALFALPLLILAGQPLHGRSSDSVLERFLTRTDTPLAAYEGRRVMRARNDRFKKEAWLETAVSFDAARGLSYSVIASGGSSYIVNRVLLAALRGEADMWRSGEPARSTFAPENYMFNAAPPASDEDAEAGIAITPRRKHVLLFDGVLYVSPVDGDLLRLEGRLSRNPSWWTTRVDVVRRYTRIQGVRVPIEFESRARVRIAGLSWMQVQYLYTSINGASTVQSMH